MHNRDAERLNLTWSSGKVTYEDRCSVLGQKGLVVWFTGLSASGKSSIAVELEKELLVRNKAVYRLDGDNLRHGLNSDLGFSIEDRDENIRRIAQVAALFKDAGIIVLVCAISPFRRMREYAKQRTGEDCFLEVYVKADIETCISRDPKGLYKKAVNHEIPDFTGISSPYEEPEKPRLILDTVETSLDVCVKRVLALCLDLI